MLMCLETRAALCLLFLAVSGSSLAAQTFTFSQPKSVVTFEAPSWGFTFQTLDLNGDGKADLALQTISGQYNVYLGDGKGGFSSVPLPIDSWDPAPVSGEPRFIDVNGDGFDDQVWGFSSFQGDQFSETNGQFLVALGDGKGGFTMATSLGGLPAGNGTADDPLVAADFNGDGKLDFALLTSGGFNVDGEHQPAAITLFLNQGSGSFAQQNTIWLEGSGHWTMVPGDFNGDGKQDLAWTQLQSDGAPLEAPYAIHYMYGKGDGTFGAVHTYWTDSAPVALASGDLNGDHRTDLVVGLAPGSAAGSTWRIATLLAKQTSGFYWASAVSSTSSTTGVELTDLNGDGHPDVIYDLNLLRAGVAGGAWGPHQVVTGQTPPTQTYSFDLPFAPLVKRGLPAVFTTSVDSSMNTHLNVQLNTSK
jgi:hypothetical protein